MKKKFTVKDMAMCGLFVALSVIGAYIKPFGGTIAFDSLPAFLAASFMGPMFGALVGVIGHLMSALLSGFPYGILLHLLIAAEMAGVMIAYGYAVKKLNLLAAVVIGIVLNGIVSPAVFIIIPGMGMAFFLSMVWPLTLVSAVNVVLAAAIQAAFNKGGVKYKK